MKDATKGEKTREAILVESGRLFSLRGFYRTGIEDIARELKIARGTLYQYFGSKEKLLVEVLFWSESRLLERLRDLVPGVSSSPEQLFGKIIQLILDHSREYGDLFGIYFSVNPEITAAYRVADQPPFTRIIGAIEELLQSCGAPFDASLRPYELGTLAFMAIESIRIADGLKLVEEDRDNFIRRRARLFLNGVLLKQEEDFE